VLGVSGQRRGVTRAERAGADYLGVTVWSTPTKPEAEARGLQASAVVGAVSFRSGIGGTTPRTPRSFDAGAVGVAVISAVASAPDPVTATRCSAAVDRFRAAQGRSVSEQRTGKATAELFEQVILRRLGASDADVLVGPKHGVDVGVVQVAPGVAMAVTTDPLFVVPAYGWERAAWFAVHILASDAATSGLPLRWMAVDLNLPPEISDQDLTSLWDAFSRTCNDLGIAVVTGHTARYDGCAWPMVGGATCVALGPDDAFVTPTMARPGDRVVVTKGAAIEATALFAATFPDRLAAGVGAEVVRQADALFEQMTVVPEARIAAAFGLRDRGVTSMHDATEGGVLGGLLEVAVASDVGMRIALDAIPVRPEVRVVCDHVGIDPYTSISEGTLIATSARPRDRLRGAWPVRIDAPSSAT
jgi:hydrogenase maturation factor